MECIQMFYIFRYKPGEKVWRLIFHNFWYFYGNYCSSVWVYFHNKQPHIFVRHLEVTPLIIKAKLRVISLLGFEPEIISLWIPKQGSRVHITSQWGFSKRLIRHCTFPLEIPGTFSKGIISSIICSYFISDAPVVYIDISSSGKGSMTGLSLISTVSSKLQIH